MDENRVSASISVDIRKHRIRIHKATLNQLGPPKYIQLLVNPDDRIVAVRGLDKKCRESHVVNSTRIRPDNSYELYSKQLVLTLMTLLPELDGEYSSAILRPIAVMTGTLTALPAILYRCPSFRPIACALKNCASVKPCSRQHSIGISLRILPR